MVDTKVVMVLLVLFALSAPSLLLLPVMVVAMVIATKDLMAKGIGELAEVCRMSGVYGVL